MIVLNDLDFDYDFDVFENGDDDADDGAFLLTFPL